jgi:hypothetical protein
MWTCHSLRQAAPGPRTRGARPHSSPRPGSDASSMLRQALPRCKPRAASSRSAWAIAASLPSESFHRRPLSISTRYKTAKTSTTTTIMVSATTAGGRTAAPPSSDSEDAELDSGPLSAFADQARRRDYADLDLGFESDQSAHEDGAAPSNSSSTQQDARSASNLPRTPSWYRPHDRCRDPLLRLRRSVLLSTTAAGDRSGSRLAHLAQDSVPRCLLASTVKQSDVTSRLLLKPVP